MGIEFSLSVDEEFQVWCLDGPLSVSAAICEKSRKLAVESNKKCGEKCGIRGIISRKYGLGPNHEICCIRRIAICAVDLLGSTVNFAYNDTRRGIAWKFCPYSRIVVISAVVISGVDCSTSRTKNNMIMESTV